MKTTIFILVLSSIAANFARSAEVPAHIELKNKSSFKGDTSGRNPFWPIGWQPASKAATKTGVEHAGPDITSAAFAVTSITYDRGARYAIVNGKPMTEGQQFGLQMGTATYQFSVKSIDDGVVTLARPGHDDILAALRRK